MKNKLIKWIKKNKILSGVIVLLFVILFAQRGVFFMGSIVDLDENCETNESLYHSNYLGDVQAWINATCTEFNETDPLPVYPNETNVTCAIYDYADAKKIIYTEDNTTIDIGIIAFPYTEGGVTATGCTQFILDNYIEEGLEPVLIEKDGRTVYDLRTVNETIREGMDFMWCNRYDNVMIGGKEGYITKYWDEYITCRVPTPTVTVMCWRNVTLTNDTEAVSCEPYLRVIPENDLEDYCEDNYYSKLECKGTAITGSEGPAGPAGPRGPAGLAFSSEIENFVKQNKYYILVAIVILIAYAVWEHGPKSGLIKNKK